MSKTTGRALSGFDSLQQRLRDALVTRKGSLVGQRDYGSTIHLLLDAKQNATFTMRLFAALTNAINNPVNGLQDLKLKRLILNNASNQSIVTIVADWLGENIELEFGV